MQISVLMSSSFSPFQMNSGITNLASSSKFTPCDVATTLEACLGGHFTPTTVKNLMYDTISTDNGRTVFKTVLVSLENGFKIETDQSPYATALSLANFSNDFVQANPLQLSGAWKINEVLVAEILTQLKDGFPQKEKKTLSPESPVQPPVRPESLNIQPPKVTSPEEALQQESSQKVYFRDYLFIRRFPGCPRITREIQEIARRKGHELLLYPVEVDRNSTDLERYWVFTGNLKTRDFVNWGIFVVRKEADGTITRSHLVTHPERGMITVNFNGTEIGDKIREMLEFLMLDGIVEAIDKFLKRLHL